MPDHIPDDLTAFEAELARLAPGSVAEPSLERLLFEAGVRSVPRRSNLLPWSVAAGLLVVATAASTAYLHERDSGRRLSETLAAQGRRLERLELKTETITEVVAAPARLDPSGYAALRARLISGSDLGAEPDPPSSPAARPAPRSTSVRRAPLDL